MLNVTTTRFKKMLEGGVWGWGGESTEIVSFRFPFPSKAPPDKFRGRGGSDNAT